MKSIIANCAAKVLISLREMKTHLAERDEYFRFGNCALVVAVALVMLGGVARADEATIAKLKMAIDKLNTAFETNNAESLEQLMTAKHIAVTPYYGGPLTRAEQLKSLADHKFTEYTSGTMQIQLLGKDVALITYPLSIKGTFRGKVVPPRTFASAVWVQQNGAWLEAYYQETAISK